MKIMGQVTRILRSAWRITRLGLVLLGAGFMLGGAAVPPGGLPAQVRARTREIAFDFSAWTAEAAFAKLSGWALSMERFLAPQTGPALVLETLEQIRLVRQLQTELLLIVSDPAVEDPQAAAGPVRQSLGDAQARLDALTPLAESVLQAQLTDILADAGLDFMGQVIPPTLFRTTDVPMSLVISPRERIERSFDVSLHAGLSAEVMAALEDQIFADLDQASLVVPVGGIGIYPTMVMQSTNIVWLTEVIAHEWVHNFLTLRPLGINYGTSETLRTINETTATLAGVELGLMILEKYYPEHVPPEVHLAQTDALPPRPEPEPDPDAFDFRAEMRITRVEVDRLLAEGQIEEAEHYMEARRQLFWQHGFPIRKINQAYFAFYGAYNDGPGGGAAGEDPVGPAVVAYRERFDHLSDFLRSIAWVNSFEDLMALLTA